MAFSGEKLRRIRLLRGKSQRDLSVAHDTISAIETGRRKPYPSTLRKLAADLDVEVGDFFEESQGKAAASHSSKTERVADEERRTLEARLREQLSDLNRFAERLEEVVYARTFDIAKSHEADKGFEETLSAMMGTLKELRNQGVNLTAGPLADEVNATLHRLSVAQQAATEAGHNVYSRDEVAERRRQAKRIQAWRDELERAV